MSLAAMTGALLPTGVASSDGGHFEPPKPHDFWQPMWHPFGSDSQLAITRPMLVMGIVAILLALWLVLATRRAAAVPTKSQFVVEIFYGFIREDVGKGMLGTKHFRQFMPLLFTLFMFIWMNNLAGVVPFLQNPPMARIAFPIALVLVVYLTYHFVGIKKHGFLGYFKHLVPPGLPAFMVPVIFLLEFITNFITRPLTLTLRLFGNMFAGHMLLLVFILGGEALLMTGGISILFGTGSFLMATVMTLFEMLVQALQAYVFTLLTASYIGGSLADEH